MDAPFTLLAALAALAGLYVLFPIAATTFARYYRKRLVRCPDAGIAAEVEIDAPRAALTALTGAPDVRVADCSLWPDRRACAQACVHEIQTQA